MRYSRRQFMRTAAIAAAGLGLGPAWLGSVRLALASQSRKIVWLTAASCSGCSVSASNYIESGGDVFEDFIDIVTETSELIFHPVYMAAAGEDARAVIDRLQQDGFLLVLEGAVPTSHDGMTCVMWHDSKGRPVTAEQAVTDLAQMAEHIICAGTCAAHGGVSTSNGNPSGACSVGQLLQDQGVTDVSLINIPGCPVHPERLFITLAEIIAGNMPELDELRRPVQFYNDKLCICTRVGIHSIGTVQEYGLAAGCLWELGCRGEAAKTDCASRGWFENSECYCNLVNAPCQGCVYPSYPDVPNDPEHQPEMITPMLRFYGDTPKGVFMEEPEDPELRTGIPAGVLELLLK